ncbi:MAG: 2-oxoacid:acceptor oxidoreductase family protein [Omnitrophica bacterium]|nr:2-oxoacid:acceptor oxidoreductase family protein [Candidatus Omnitrophota bacterium]
MTETKILISGFGGQGLMSLGKILAKAALLENRYTSWFPSYGPEMRGGTAHCFVKISNSPIGSPFIDEPDIAIILNQLSLEKFKKQLKSKSLLILNSDLTRSNFHSQGIKVISLPLNRIALECGNIKVVNIIALGIFFEVKKNFFKRETIVKVLKDTFAQGEILEANLKAFGLGIEAVSR